MGAPVVHIILKELHISAKLLLLGWHLGVCSDALSSQFQSAIASALPRPVHLQGLDARKTYIFFAHPQITNPFQPQKCLKPSFYTMSKWIKSKKGKNRTCSDMFGIDV
jgi:hypothetical protein